MAQNIVQQLRWLHQAQTRKLANHYARPPQSTNTELRPLNQLSPHINIRTKHYKLVSEQEKQNRFPERSYCMQSNPMLSTRRSSPEARHRGERITRTETSTGRVPAQSHQCTIHGASCAQINRVNNVLEICFTNNTNIIHNVKVTLALASYHNVIEQLMYEPKVSKNI